MKVTRKRAGRTFYRAGAAVALLLAASAGYPQSPGMAHLLPGPGKAGLREGGPHNGKMRRARAPESTAPSAI
ncbi:hypothetical protein ACU4GD_27570 [Cupriavidus basilensis]